MQNSVNRSVRTMAMIIGLLSMLTAGPVLAESWQLTASEWSRPRTGERVRDLPAVNAAVNAWLAEPAARIELRHASGEQGSLWAAELRDWLIALGIPQDRIDILPARLPEDRLELEVDTP